MSSCNLRGVITSFLTVMTCGLVFADYPETWTVRHEYLAGVPQPYKSRNLRFDAVMTGQSYNEMVSGTASEFSFNTFITAVDPYVENVPAWNAFKIKEVRLKVGGKVVALDLSSIASPNYVSSYNREVRWATNEFDHDTGVAIELEVDARFERWDYSATPTDPDGYGPPPPELVEFEEATISLNHTVTAYNKGLALATTVVWDGSAWIVEAPTDTNVPGVAEEGATSARGKLSSAKHEVYSGVHHEKLQLAQFLDSNGNPEAGNTPKLLETTAFYAMTHGISPVDILDKAAGQMSQFNNIHPVTKAPDSESVFVREVPPMNFAWFYACELGDDGRDWRIKLNIHEKKGAVFGFKKVVWQLLLAGNSQPITTPYLDSESVLLDKLYDHSNELFDRMLQSQTANTSLGIANNAYPPRGMPTVSGVDQQGNPTTWEFRQERMYLFGGSHAKLVGVYRPEPDEAIEVYGGWYCVFADTVPPAGPGGQ